MPDGAPRPSVALVVILREIADTVEQRMAEGADLEHAVASLDASTLAVLGGYLGYGDVAVTHTLGVQTQAIADVTRAVDQQTPVWRAGVDALERQADALRRSADTRSTLLGWLKTFSEGRIAAAIGGIIVSALTMWALSHGWIPEAP